MQKPNRKFLMFVTALLIVVWVGIVINYRRLLQTSLKTCSGQEFIPTIKQIDNGQVVLSNGERLSRGEVYRIGESVQISLLSTDDQGAVLFYQSETTSGEAGVATPFTTVYRCKLFIPNDSQLYQSHHMKSVLPPEQLIDHGWTVDKYTEFVILDSFYLTDPSDTSHLTVDVNYPTDSTGKIAYRIWIEIRTYESSAIAEKALEVEQRAYYDHLPATDAGFEGCAPELCIHLAQFDDRLLILSMHSLHIAGRTHKIVDQDWQFILDAVKMGLSHDPPND